MARVSLPAVNTLSKTGSTKLRGDVTLTGGTNVTLTQSGQDISIAAASGGIGGSTGSTDRAIIIANGTGGATVQASTPIINSDGGIEAETNTTSTAPLELTQSDGNQESPILAINGVDGVNIGMPGLAIGPNTNALLHVGYYKKKVNGSDTANFGDGDRLLYGSIWCEDCVGANAPIKAPEGNRRADTIKAGEIIISRNEFTGELIAGEVDKVEFHPNPERAGVFINDYPWPISIFHRAWINDDYVLISTLKVGDYFRNSKNEKVWCYQITPAPLQPTYNFRMKNQKHPNYFVDDLLVHNKCPFFFYLDESMEHPWRCQGTFITGMDSPEKEGVHTLELKDWSDKYYMRELEEERSFIKHMELLAVTKDQKVKIPAKMKFPLQLKQEDIIPIEFEKRPEETLKLYLLSAGYYVENK